MGWFSPFVYKNKEGRKFWLHTKEKGKTKLYYFSKDSAGAMFSVPGGYEVIENETTHLPFLKKKAGNKKKEKTGIVKTDSGTTGEQPPKADAEKENKQ